MWFDMWFGSFFFSSIAPESQFKRCLIFPLHFLHFNVRVSCLFVGSALGPTAEAGAGAGNPLTLEECDTAIVFAIQAKGPAPEHMVTKPFRR